VAKVETGMGSRDCLMWHSMVGEVLALEFWARWARSNRGGCRIHCEGVSDCLCGSVYRLEIPKLKYRAGCQFHREGVSEYPRRQQSVHWPVVPNLEDKAAATGSAQASLMLWSVEKVQETAS